ncbi:copper amine oxidase [Paenibacillus xylanexedens]|uniref:copper amine oxidase n=1 Tax=Paenibacillus xylanexedens TaxID=528191 RepID=UPI0028E6BB65|nr:copper amine oxidase [Paenibacillus xylanexedens]
MKKVAYIAMGFLLGIVFMTAGAAFADQVKSLIGKKVTGEYTVIVNGSKLSDKGAVIDSKANVPARTLSEALGADVSVNGKVITITSVEGSNETNESSPSDTTTSQTNKYIGGTKSSLNQLKDSTVNNVIAPLKKARETTASALEELEAIGNEDAAKVSEQRLSEYDSEIAKYEAELKLIDEALLTAK